MLVLRKTTPPFFSQTTSFTDLLSDKIFDCSMKELDMPSTKTPIHDVIENDNEYIVELLLAGINKEDISINIEKDMLIVKAERKEKKEIKDIKYNRKETYFGKYERSFKLPDEIDDDNVQASLNDGILKINVPKINEKIKSTKKVIEIK